MVTIDGYKLVDSNGDEPTNVREVYVFAQKHNRESDLKIQIFKSHQSLDYSLIVEAGLSVKLRGVDLDAAAIDQIISCHYIVTGRGLFFFDAATVSFLKRATDNPSAMELISLLRKLPPDRRPTEDTLTAYLTKFTEQNQASTDIEFTVDLYPYQRAGFDWLKSRCLSGRGSILADDMGLGKTAQVISLIADNLRRNEAGKVLIVVPNSLVANWLNEFSKFTRGIYPYVHWGPDRVGFTRSLDREQVVITTYSTITNDLALFQGVFFDLAIFDEASVLKNPDSMRTQTVSNLSFGCAIAMTGTPFENSMMDLWSLSNVVCNDFLGDRATFYRNYVAQGVLELRQNEIDAVEEKLRPILLRRMKTEVLDDLPSKLDIYKPLSMGDTEQRKYNLLEQNIRNNKHDKANALALIAHLRKFTAHPLLLNERLGEASFDDMVMTSSKFSYLATALKTVKLAGEKALVFANHVALLDKFVACFSDVMNVPCWKIDGSISDRQEVIKAFTDVESAAFLFLNPITSGMGLNITAANHVFHYSRQWNPALEEQATARAYRNGQEKSVNAYYFYYADSIEQTIHERIMIKSEIAGDLIKRTQFWADEDELIMSLL